jgi:hypothetical protein
MSRYPREKIVTLKLFIITEKARAKERKYDGVGVMSVACAVRDTSAISGACLLERPC